SIVPSCKRAAASVLPSGLNERDETKAGPCLPSVAFNVGRSKDGGQNRTRPSHTASPVLSTTSDTTTRRITSALRFITPRSSRRPSVSLRVHEPLHEFIDYATPLHHRAGVRRILRPRAIKVRAEWQHLASVVAQFRTQAVAFLVGQV